MVKMNFAFALGHDQSMVEILGRLACEIFRIESCAGNVGKFFPFFYQKGLTNKYLGLIIISERNKEDTKMTRDDMLDGIIRKYGFEHERTIKFAAMCDNPKVDTGRLAQLFIKWMGERLY